MATATIEDLSPELLVEIFSHYIESEGQIAFSRNVTPVCKRWREFSSVPSLWKSVHLRDWKYAQSLIKRGSLCHTRNLRVSIPHVNIKARKYGAKALDELLHLLSVISRTPNLKSIEILSSFIDSTMMMALAKYCLNLEHLHLRMEVGKYGKLTIEEMGPIVTNCGSKLKFLNFDLCDIEDSERVISNVAARCPSLEVFKWRNLSFVSQRFEGTFPICKLRSRCPQLRILELSYCKIVVTGEETCSGFEELVVFKARDCRFHELDLGSLLNNSRNLEYLELDWNDDLILAKVPMIPSNKVTFLKMWLKDNDINLEDLERAVSKWKHSLLHLQILISNYDITSLFRHFLNGNLTPKLRTLVLKVDSIDLSLLKMFIQKSTDLNRLSVLMEKVFQEWKVFGDREQVMKFQESL